MKIIFLNRNNGTPSWVEYSGATYTIHGNYVIIHHGNRNIVYSLSSIDEIQEHPTW